MEEKLFTAIVETTYTINDVYRRVRLIKEFLEKKFFFTEEKTISEFLQEQQQLPADIDTISRWSNIVNLLTKDNYYKTLNKIKENIKHLPKVTIYIPFVLPDKEIAKLGFWMRKNVHSQVFLNIRLDPETVGGCSLVWKGVYRDFSLKSVFAKKREDILYAIQGQLTKN